MATKYEPREHVIDAELANGNLEAWKQVLGFSKPTVSCRCPSCDAVTEQWWSYCAMCGHHIAAD
jgi:hypothetical protein